MTETERWVALLNACGVAPIAVVRRELREMIGDCPEQPRTALDARIWLFDLAWSDGDEPGLTERVTRALVER